MVLGVFGETVIPDVQFGPAHRELIYRQGRLVYHTKTEKWGTVELGAMISLLIKIQNKFLVNH
jgi:hypothetical protein